MATSARRPTLKAPVRNPTLPPRGDGAPVTFTSGCGVAATADKLRKAGVGWAVLETLASIVPAPPLLVGTVEGQKRGTRCWTKGPNRNQLREAIVWLPKHKEAFICPPPPRLIS